MPLDTPPLWHFTLTRFPGALGAGAQKCGVGVDWSACLLRSCMKARRKCARGWRQRSSPTSPSAAEAHRCDSSPVDV